MRTMVIGTLVAGLMLAGSTRVGAQEPQAILDKALKAHGGLEKLTKYKAVQTKGKGRVEVAGGVEFTQESAVQIPNKIKEVIHATVNGMQQDMTSVYNGKQGWMVIGGMTIDMPPNVLDAVKDALEMASLARLAFVGGKDYELTSLGEAKVNDRPALGVKVTRKGQNEVNLYFDKDTGLLAKIEHRTKDAMTGKEVNEERVITEYKDVDGMKSPKKVVINRDGAKYIELEVTETKLLEKLDDSEFDKP